MGREMFGYFVDEDKYYCWYCNEVKLIDEFVKDISKSLGFKTKCKKCYREYHRDWRGNSEKYDEYIKNGVNRSYHKEYYEKNKDRLIGLQKIYQENNKEKLSEYNKKRYKEKGKEYYEKNKDKLKEDKKK